MRINGTKIQVKVLKRNIGLFHRAFVFEDHDKEVMPEMIEWLSFNCTENFIVTEVRSSIVAGGYSNNKKAFKLGRFKLTGKSAKNRDLATIYEVRLDKVDLLAFRLRWLDEDPNEID